jgi:hypothetical protein
VESNRTINIALFKRFSGGEVGRGTNSILLNLLEKSSRDRRLFAINLRRERSAGFDAITGSGAGTAWMLVYYQYLVAKSI